MTETNPHPETRVTSERGIKAHIMGIDGTWRRACTMAGRDRAEGKDKMTKRATATLVWTREEDDQLRAAAASGESIAELSKRLCRSEKAIWHRVVKIGIELSPQRKKSGLLRRLVDGAK